MESPRKGEIPSRRRSLRFGALFIGLVVVLLTPAGYSMRTPEANAQLRVIGGETADPKQWHSIVSIGVREKKRGWATFEGVGLGRYGDTAAATESEQSLLQIDLRGDRSQTKQIKDLGWPEYQLKYFVADRRVSRVGTWAARAWNRAGVRYKFQRTGNRSVADVVLRESRICGTGQANVGYQGEAPAIAWLSACSSSVDRAIATHELGHILGLWHYGKCKLMSTVICRNISALPGRREKRLLRQMARNRDRVVREAPKEPAIKIIAPEVEVDDYGDGDLGASVNFRVRMTATFAERFWKIPKVSISSDDPDASCEGENTEWPDGEYGPWGWGWSRSWSITDYAYCFLDKPEGTHTITVRAMSRRGAVVSDSYALEVQ